LASSRSGDLHHSYRTNEEIANGECSRCTVVRLLNLHSMAGSAGAIKAPRSLSIRSFTSEGDLSHALYNQGTAGLIPHL
jgi:hypothetical protein